VRTRQIDCAISSRRLTDPRVDGFRVHREEYVLCAAPGLLADEPFEAIEHAERHHLVDIGPELPLSSYYRDALPDGGRFRFAGVLHMGTIAAIRTAVLQGQGVAVLPLYLVRPDLEQGRIVRLLSHLEPEHDWFRLIHRSDDPRLSLLRTIADTLGSEALR
jgi:LysR family glycine cleavage system transcriptional activator